MGRPRRQMLATADETCHPPQSLQEGQAIGQVNKAEGKNLYTVKLPATEDLLLVELPARFRSTIWIKRGSYVVVDTSAFDNRDNKLAGEIVNVIREEKTWRKQSYWYYPPVPDVASLDEPSRPPEFRPKQTDPDSSEEESTMGRMPPSEPSDEE